MEGKESGKRKKIFLYALGAGAIGTAAFFGYKLIKGKPVNDASSAEDPEAKITPILKRITANNSNDNFPLKSGSKGAKVIQLQQALERILGKVAMAKITKIDGNFKKGTETALSMAKLPALIDELTFNRLTNPKMLGAGFNPKAMGDKLFTAANRKDFNTSINLLKQISSSSEYASVNAYFIAQQFFSVSKSIVTFLLDSFSSNSFYKEQIKTEFLRMGLKLDTDSGKWSLAGISIKEDIITLRDTYVLDKFNNKIKVGPDTILGARISISNGMAYFKDIHHNIHSVPNRDVGKVSR